MKQKIVGYFMDEESHWVAKLECGHGQHVRHDPPWMEREWVTSKEGRLTRLGMELNCVRCDEVGRAVAQVLMKEMKKVALEAYQVAGISGLCEEGRLEAALGAFDTLPVQDLIERALRPNGPKTRAGS